MRRFERLAAIAALALITPVATAVTHSQAPGLTRTIYATVTQSDGTPVLDMRADEFEVREGGRVQEFSARSATNPLRVALIVSDRGGGQFQQGALTFCEAMLGNGEVGITGLVVQPERVTDFTNSPDALRAAILRLGRRSGVTNAGTQLIEAILDAAKVVRRDGSRSAIVIMRAGGEDTTPIAASTVLNAIRASRATMYVISPAGVDRNPMRSNQYGESVTVVPTVLGGGAGESGGRQIDVAINTMRPVMQQVASELLSQYEITYTLPSGTKPNERVSVTSKRKGVTVRAPTRVAN
jgi:VWFA-related protein